MIDVLSPASRPYGALDIRGCLPGNQPAPFGWLAFFLIVETIDRQMKCFEILCGEHPTEAAALAAASAAFHSHHSHDADLGHHAMRVDKVLSELSVLSQLRSLRRSGEVPALKHPAPVVRKFVG